jgi:glycine/D-amino acid oxidase-like deaminating enzyme
VRHEVASLRLASSRERMEELARQAGWAKTFDLPLELISADEAQEPFPRTSSDGVLGAAYLPTRRLFRTEPAHFALAEEARRGGAEIATRKAARSRSAAGAAARRLVVADVPTPAAASMLACDFLTVETAFLERIYVLFFISLAKRRIEHVACSANPDGRSVAELYQTAV